MKYANKYYRAAYSANLYFAGAAGCGLCGGHDFSVSVNCIGEVEKMAEGRPPQRKSVKSDIGVTQNKRLAFFLVVFLSLLILLIIRIAWIQIVRGSEYSRAAIEQQTSDSEVAAKRGLIYDCNMKILANNVTVETISITPERVRENEDTDALAQCMAEALDMDVESIKSKFEKNSNFEYIKRKVDKSKADIIRQYVNDNDISGVTVTEDVKRDYPYNNLASHVFGFVGDDNQGLDGIEMVYDDELSGTPGRVISAIEPGGLQMPDTYEEYIEPEDGNGIVLTIDETIQHITEKYLENARIENELEEGAAAIVMDVKTGEILAMSTKPDYDLNEPFAITDAVKEQNPGIEEELANLSGIEYNERLTEALTSIRRNKAVVDTYEPGSTFKMAVAAMALEDNVVSLDDTFYCGGKVKVADYDISCANKSGHGTQTFAEAVQNSCNVAFIAIGQRIGISRFKEYVNWFGFRSKTGIELPGEATGLFYTDDAFNITELATSSFGQGLTITPLQMITFASAIGNGGKMYKPHLVKKIVDSEGNTVEEIEPEFVRQVVSEETADTLCELLESVVSKGGGKNAYIAGYHIAGKTGTSEKLPRGSQKYIASFIAIAPANDPQVACLVKLDQPPVGNTYYGGMIAAPVVKNIMSETLQYLGVEPDYSEDELEYVDITVPNLADMTKSEATEVLSELGLSVRFIGSGETVTDQIPKAYSKVSSGTKIAAYTGDAVVEKTATVPNVVGMSASAANSAITNAGLNVKVSGAAVGQSGYAVCSAQSPSAGTSVEPGTVVTIAFTYTEIAD